MLKTRLCGSYGETGTRIRGKSADLLAHISPDFLNSAGQILQPSRRIFHNWFELEGNFCFFTNGYNGFFPDSTYFGC